MGSRILRFEGRLWRAELPRRHDNVRGSQKLCHSCTARLRHGSRTNGSYNDTKVVTIYLSTRQEPLQSVVLEARRAPEDKITHVTISPPPKTVIEEE